MRGMMINMRQLAKLLKELTLSESQASTLKQTILNGQILLSGLTVLNERLVDGAVEPGDEYLASFFSSEANQYIKQTELFAQEMVIVNGR